MIRFVVYDAKAKRYRNVDEAATYDDIDRVRRFENVEEATAAITDRFDNPVKFEVHAVEFQPTVTQKYAFQMAAVEA